MKLNKRQNEILEDLMFYEKDQEIKNPFSGVKVTLDGKGAAIYDFIMGCQMMGNYKDMDQARYMFAELYPKEYMKLID